MSATGIVNYIQYPLPFNSVYGRISMSDVTLDEQMRNVLKFSYWEGNSAGAMSTGFNSNDEGFIQLTEEPSDETAIIFHLGIYAKKDCEFYIINYEFYDESVNIGETQISEKSWTMHRRKFRIGAGQKLEFTNVMIISVGVVDTSVNSIEYYGKNAMLDMSITTVGSLKLLSLDGNINIGIIDPFIQDINGLINGLEEENETDQNGMVSL